MSKNHKKPSDIKVVSTSLAVSVSDVLLNLLVATLTGSTVMLSQALQGLSDLVTGATLYIGVRRSKREADRRFQFGHGREIFFWVLMAGIFMFMGTGGLSVFFGYRQLVSPNDLENLALALGMLIFGFFTNGYALSLSVKRLHHSRTEVGWWHQLWRSSIVETKATFLIDFMGTAAALIGLIALGIFAVTGNARLDGIGSIAIGVSMMISSLLLIKDVRGLIVGRSVGRDLTEQIIGATKTVDGVQEVLDIRTMYLGSARLLVIVEVHIKDGLETDQIEQIVDNVKAVVMSSIPQVEHIQVEIETPDGELQKLI